MADVIRATPRNQLLGLLADVLQGGSNFASKPFGYDNPPVRGLLDLLQVPAVTNTLNELSYGGALGTGSGMTYRPKADTLDAAMAVAPLLGGASRAVNTGAAAIGRRLGPSVTALVNRTMAQGGRPAQMLEDLAQGTVSPMTVWHGSPHQFSKFDASKIGTGEGAQAYGHGLYLAESPEVAKGYQAANMGRARAGDGFLDSLPPGVQVDAYNLLQSKVRGPIGDARLEALRTTLKPNQFEKLEAAYRGGDSSLYKVDLPDDQIAKMLNWDKPLSQQAPEVRAALAKVGGDWTKQSLKTGSPTGSQVYLTDLQNDFPDAISATKALKEAGIPGIRYLDGGSRGTGGGTSNFVVFPGNEDMLTILERNGQPVNALRGLLER